MLFEGIVIGFVYAIIPGGTILVGLNLAIARGYHRTAAFTYGVLLIDIVYAFLAVTAAGAATDAYASLIGTFPSVLAGMQIALIAGLGGYGTYLLLGSRPLVEGGLQGGFLEREGDRKTSSLQYLFLGLTLKVSTLASPSFLAGFALLTSQAGSLGLSSWSIGDRLTFAAGFGFGSFLYLQLCMRLASRYTQRLLCANVMRIRKGLGAGFAALGGLLFFHMLRGWIG